MVRRAVNERQAWRGSVRSAMDRMIRSRNNAVHAGWRLLWSRSTTTNAGGCVLLLLLLAPRRVEVACGSARRGAEAGVGRLFFLRTELSFVRAVRVVLFFFLLRVRHG